MPITIDGSGTITGAATLATTVASPTFTTPNINSAQFATVSGTAPIYPCRAWVNFNGTGTVAIRASGNVSSITDNGTGDYTVNLTTALADANYNFVAAGDPVSAGGNGLIQKNFDFAPTTSTLRIRSVNPGTGFFDTAFACVSIFR
jgi:hypothetical protein